jgi:hypothetical protein
MHQGRVAAVALSGDFFFYPADQLAAMEQGLIGARLSQIQGIVEEFYRCRDIESPGVTPRDWSVVLGLE